MTAHPTPHSVDVAIIGGGPAGLSAAIALGRSRRRVLVIDAGEPRNRVSAHAHNVFSRDGAAPLALLAAAREQASAYGIRILDDRVIDADRVAGQLTLTSASSGTITARRVVIAAGLTDVLPDVPGLASHWGDSVVHCPYCHGWEVRDRQIVVLGTSPHSARQALMFTQLSDDVVLVRHDSPADPEIEADLVALGGRIVEGRAAHIVDDAAGALRGVVLADGTELPAGAVAVATTLHAHTELFERLGGAPAAVDGVGLVIPADPTGRTPVAGVWAAGNATDAMAMVGAAAAAGTMTGAALNMDLLLEDAAARR